MLVFGDNGQVETLKTKTCGYTTNTGDKATFYTKFATEVIDLPGNLVCKLTPSGETTAIDLTATTTQDLGMKHFKDILCNTKVGEYIRDSDAIVVLGDMVYPEVKGFYDKTKFGEAISTTNTKKWSTQWEERVRCGWNIFGSLLKNYEAVCGVNKVVGAAAKLWSGNKIPSAFQLIAGNHAFDVNNVVDFEKQFTLTQIGGGLRGYIRSFFNYNNGDIDPIFTVTTVGKVTVQTLDINASIIGCLQNSFLADGDPKESDYNDCVATANMATTFSESDALAYYDKIVLGIKKFTTNATWRVVRCHQPPFNIEGPDQKPFLKYKRSGSTKTLVDLMNDYGVEMIIASHHHSSQVLAYERTQKWKFLKGAASAVTGTAIDLGASTLPMTGNGTPKHNYMYTFVIGNSGRFLDPIQPDEKTVATLLWAKGNSVTDEKMCKNTNASTKYGGANFEFASTSVTVTFFEDNGSNTIGTKVFTVNKGEGDDAVFRSKVAAKAARRRLKRTNKLKK